MGSCTLTSNINAHEIEIQDQIKEDNHRISSAFNVKSNNQLFQLSTFITSKSKVHCEQKMVCKSISTDQDDNNVDLKAIQIQNKKPSSINFQSSIMDSHQEQSLQFNQKQNLVKQKSGKKGKRNSSIRISGDFLKIKQKQATAQYKVLSKITNKKIGELYKVLDRTTSQIRSLQIIQQDKACSTTLHQINLLKKLDHPHIFHLYDVFLKKGFYYIVGQYIEGDNILCLTKQNQSISQKKISKVIKEVLQALNYIHFRGIMHRNIKPQTIVFQTKLKKQKPALPAIKLINFKKAAQITARREQLTNFYFASPETFLGGHNQKCDIWSVGVILYMLVIGQLPFQGQNRQQIKKNIIGEDLVFKGKKWQNKSQSLINLLKSLLQKNPSRRLSAKQALLSSWFQQASQKDKILISKNTMKNILCTGGDSKFKTIIKTYLVKMTTSVQQRQQMARKFQSMDKDKSGFIDKSQIILAYKQIYGEQISKDVNIDYIIQKIDVNSSGLIDFSQFMAAISRADTLFAKERLQKAFQFIDLDGTGQIQISQLIDLLHSELQNQQQDEQDQQVAEILKDFDRDGDKTISKKQFIDFFLKLKDTNHIKSTSKFRVNDGHL